MQIFCVKKAGTQASGLWIFSQAGGSRSYCMSEGEFLEGEGAALFEDGDEAAEVGRGHVRLEGWLVLPCFYDFDVVVGGEA